MVTFLSFCKFHCMPFKSVPFNHVIPNFSQRSRFVVEKPVEKAHKLSILARHDASARGLFKHGDLKVLIIATTAALCHSRKLNKNLTILTRQLTKIRYFIYSVHTGNVYGKRRGGGRERERERERGMRISSRFVLLFNGIVKSIFFL